MALLQLAITSLGERAELIKQADQVQPHMHLLQGAQLKFIVSLQQLYPQADQVRRCWFVHASNHKPNARCICIVYMPSNLDCFHLKLCKHLMVKGW